MEQPTKVVISMWQKVGTLRSFTIRPQEFRSRGPFPEPPPWFEAG